MALAFLIGLVIVLRPAGVAGQCPSQCCTVTYVSVTPECACDTAVGTLVIVFRVVCFTCEPYYGSVSEPVTGIRNAAFVLISTETHQTKEYENVPVFPGTIEGEYRATIPIAPDGPAGPVLVYVKGNSMQFDGSTGPVNNMSSEQTEDTSDLSLVDIRRAVPSSPLAQIFQGYELPILFILLAVIVALLAWDIFARRRRKPTKLTLVREPYPEPAGRGSQTRSRRYQP